MQLVREMEATFRQLPLKSADYAAFHSAVISNNSPSKWFVLLECVDIIAEQKEDLFRRIRYAVFCFTYAYKCRQSIGVYLQAFTPSVPGDNPNPVPKYYTTTQ